MQRDRRQLIINDSRSVMEDGDVKSETPCEGLGKVVFPSEANTFVTILFDKTRD